MSISWIWESARRIFRIAPDPAELRRQHNQAVELALQNLLTESLMRSCANERKKLDLVLEVQGLVQSHVTALMPLIRAAGDNKHNKDTSGLDYVLGTINQAVERRISTMQQLDIEIQFETKVQALLRRRLEKQSKLLTLAPIMELTKGGTKNAKDLNTIARLSEEEQSVEDALSEIDELLIPHDVKRPEPSAPLLQAVAVEPGVSQPQQQQQHAYVAQILSTLVKEPVLAAAAAPVQEPIVL
jgi:hypothetical protein